MEIMDVIKYNGRPDVFAWKYPGEELGTWSQLVVNQSQEAVLVKGGSVADVFGPGTHTLDTKNIPILNKIINLPFGGKSPFKAEVWYINKGYYLDIKWGNTNADSDSGSKVWNIYSDTLEWSIWNSCSRFGEVFDKTCDDHECF